MWKQAQVIDVAEERLKKRFPPGEQVGRCELNESGIIHERDGQILVWGLNGVLSDDLLLRFHV